jgi:hypothetical protein
VRRQFAIGHYFNCRMAGSSASEIMRTPGGIGRAARL